MTNPLYSHHPASFLPSRVKSCEARFEVRLDGQPPGDDRGLDVDASGRGTLSEPRMYQRDAAARTFEITFQDAGARAYVFTFG